MANPVAQELSAAPWGTGLSMVLLVVLAKGLGFLREPVIASTLGANSSSDAYYVAIALPFLLFNLFGLPFALLVTARVAGAQGGIARTQGQVFYRRALWWGCAASSLAAAALVLLSRQVIRFYAPGIEGARLDEAAALARLGAVALPALVLQAICSGRLFAEYRFTTVYAWLATGSLVGLMVVVSAVPHYGPAAAVVAFVATWWTTAIALLVLSHRRHESMQSDMVEPWSVDLGSGVVYRAIVIQVFFQGSGLLVYRFASRLAPGEIAATLFASKIVMAICETVVLTAGVLVFPRIARFVQERDERAIGRVVMHALEWLIPVTVVFMVLLVASRTELVTLIYYRRAFDQNAVSLVSRALLGYAPIVVGIALTEILHRAMVLRGRVVGYAVVFGAGLLVNWWACFVLVPRFGIIGVTAGTSMGILVASVGLWSYAHRRLPSLQSLSIGILVARTIAAAAIALAVVTTGRAHITTPATPASQLLLLVGVALAVSAVFAGVMLLLGYRWPRLAPAGDRVATD